MILNIDNLGIVKHVSIDLAKKFTLFCGPNSTGKTYTSYIIQAFLDEDRMFPQLSFIAEFLNSVKAGRKVILEKKYITEWLAANCYSVKCRLGDIFAISEESKERLFDKFSIHADFSDDDYSKIVGSSFKSHIKFGSEFLDIDKPSDSNAISIETNMDLSESSVFVIVNNLLRSLSLSGISGVRMLPVERNSIYTFKTELSISRNELVERIHQLGKDDADLFDIVNRSSRRYPQAIRASLKTANDLAVVQKRLSPFAEVADIIESDLLLGSVNITKDGDVEFSPHGMSETRKIPFHLSSSIVKTMSSLIIYLRHLAQKGDVLIVDEPEMNFHPDVQILLAKVFALLSNKGMKVIVSTHSDYIIREVNNLIMASALDERGNGEIVKELGYRDDELISHNDVSVLFFNKTGESVVNVEELAIDEEGFSVETIDSAIMKQNRDAERLYSLLSDIED